MRIEAIPEVVHTNHGPWVVPANTTDVYEYIPPPGHKLLSWGFYFDSPGAFMVFNSAQINAGVDGAGQFNASATNTDPSNSHYVRWYFVLLKD